MKAEENRKDSRFAKGTVELFETNRKYEVRYLGKRMKVVVKSYRLQWKSQHTSVNSWKQPFQRSHRHPLTTPLRVHFAHNHTEMKSVYLS